MPPPPVPSKAKAKPKLTTVAKPAHIPKAQTGGMSMNDLRACCNALKKLKVHKSAMLSMQPVDPVRDHAPKCVSLISIIDSCADGFMIATMR